MRQRGPTATALSPGVYMDTAQPLGSCNNAIHPEIGPGAATALNPPGVFVAATAAIGSTFAGMTPALSRIQTPALPSLLPKRPDAYDAISRFPRTTCGTHTVNMHQQHSLLDSKLRKKNKTRRPGMLQTNGEGGRNWHSLKVTIRRTSQTHKIHPTVCNSVSSERTNGYPNNAHLTDVSALDIESVNCLLPSNFNRSLLSSVPNGTTVDPVQTRVDASTSTVDCATITEPDLLGPCEAGTKIVVEGVVWLEAAGMLVLNVQWRGRAYMGTLLDASKQNFGPSCLDKGITSALSLLNGRRAWSQNSTGGRFRKRGMHHFHHHHHHPYHHHRHHSGASMTTRSAAAAAAAAAAAVAVSASTTPSLSSGLVHTSSTESLDALDDKQPDCPEQSTIPTTENNPTSNTNDASRFCMYDLELTTDYVPTQPQRGAKRRRKRGAGAGRPYRRVATKLTTQRNSSTAVLSQSLEDDLTDDVHNVEMIPPPDYSAATLFSCPYKGCERTFCDLLSMRYHFSLGHSNIEESDPSSVWRNSDSHDQVDLLTSNINRNDTHSHDHSTSPPKLGRAHGSVKGPGLDSCESSFNRTASDDRFDDNLAPPKLHRIVSIPESASEFSQPFSGSSPLKQSLSPGFSDEPPAPSPAYSDISEDATVPAVHNLSTGGTTNLPHDSSCDLFPTGQTVLSPLTSFVPRQANMDFHTSPSIASPALTYSPGIRHENQNGFYFPVNLVSSQLVPTSLPATTTTTTRPTTVIPPSLTISNSPNDRRFNEHGLSPIPLPTYHLSVTQGSYLLQTPLTVNTMVPISTIHPNQHTVFIPGVNSFSVPTVVSCCTSDNPTNVSGAIINSRNSTISVGHVSQSVASVTVPNLDTLLHYTQRNLGVARLSSIAEQHCSPSHIQMSVPCQMVRNDSSHFRSRTDVPSNCPLSNGSNRTAYER